MKNSKIVALVATAALLVVGAAMTAFAAAGWVEVDGIWKYFDKNGEEVTESWKKSGNDWYWLDENGEMATATLVEDGENFYYVDADGKMVKNQWVQVENLDDVDGFGDTIWYYFQNSGRAIRSTDGLAKKTVGGKKYIFDEEGRMQFGWVSLATNEMVDDEDNNAYLTAEYYCGEPDDGEVRINKWEYLYIVEGDKDDSNKWFYFGPKGEKYEGTTDAYAVKTINGKKYAFDEFGVMQAEWVAAASRATSASANISSYAWFRDAEDGAKLTKGWFRVIPQEQVDNDEWKDETNHWFYADGKGNLYKNAIKTINGKQYGFGDNGEMVSGLQYVEWDSTENVYYFMGVSSDPTSATNLNIDDVTKVDSANPYIPTSDKCGLYFFSDDEEGDGARKTGALKADIDGDATAFKFIAKGVNKGVGVNGKDGNYYYVNGKKVTADEDIKVQAFNATWTDADGIASLQLLGGTVARGNWTNSANDRVLITSTGAIVKRGTKTDADGYKYTVANYVVTKCEATN